MSQTQTLTQTQVLPVRLKLPQSNASTIKLPLGIPKSFNVPKPETLNIAEVKVPELDLKVLPLNAQLSLTNNVGTTTIGEIPNVVNPVTAPPIRPTLQNASMTDVFNKTVTKSQKAQMQKNIIIEEGKLPQLKVTETDIRLFSFEEMKRRAFFEVENAEDTGIGSINDPRGGVFDDNSLCTTCKKGNFLCTGHEGIIVFGKPIIHPKGISILIKILKSICIDCGELKVSRQILEENRILKKSGEHRLDAVLKIAESYPCSREPRKGEEKCNPNPTFISKTSKDMDTIWIEEKFPGKKEKYETQMDTCDVLAILKSISDEDANLLGFQAPSRPENLIMQAMMVIPQISRVPAIRDGQVWPHHLTIMLKDIVAENLKIIERMAQNEEKTCSTKNNDTKAKKSTKKNKTLTEADEFQAYNNLIFKVKHFMDNSDKKWTHPPQGAFESIKDIVQGKEGLINALLLGKRVNFVARTVISPDPSLKFGQVRVPRIWESVLTQPVKVFKENLPSILLLWKQGHITHITPGSGPFQGSKIQVTETTKPKYTPQVGDVVERYARNGDVVLFNRQPTIQKEGMMGYEVVLGEGQTIGLHMAACHPHNADMDGDESQVHMLQAIDAIVEAMQIANTRQCITNPQSNKAMANVPMDAMTASYLMSIDDQKVMDEDTYMDIVQLLTNTDSRTRFEERLQQYKVLPGSTRAVISLLFPPDFFYRKGNVVISEGIFVKGIMGKGNWGPVVNSIPMEFYMQYGTERTAQLLTDAPYLFNRWMLDNPYSVKYSDCLIDDPEYAQKVQDQISNARFLVGAIQSRREKRIAYEAKMGLPENKIEYEREEEEIKNALNNARNISARLSMESLPKNNSIVVSATAGTKGDAININAITGLLGQQFVRGGRMPRTMTGGTRCLPYFYPGDTSIESGGFCTSSFIHGLNMAELFFTAIGGRESVTDNALKVPMSGFISKRLVRNLEDLTIKNNGTVANSTGIITTFAYGNDGFSPGALTYVDSKIGKKLSFMNFKAVADVFNTRYHYSPSNIV
jgi:DNA-directed RNA polymerase beta' subunit